MNDRRSFGFMIVSFCLIVVAALMSNYQTPGHNKTLFAADKLPLATYNFYTVKVLRVIDGDTVDVEFHIWKDIILQKRIRFMDVDAWEVRGEQRERGLRAKQFIEQLLTNRQVCLYTAGDTGKYGRTLGILYVKVNGRMLNVNNQLRLHGHLKTSGDL